MNIRIVALAALLSTGHAVDYSAAALNDEITSLPGLDISTIDFRLFSGYVDVSPPSEPSTRSIFYWFVESQGDASADPLLLWTNGGPGCSGMAGFLTEMGPFELDAATGSPLLLPREFAWNRLSSMVFIEQPAGVGFSTASGAPIAYDDAQAAADNARFVEGFLTRFDAYKNADFYLTSESCA